MFVILTLRVPSCVKLLGVHICSNVLRNTQVGKTVLIFFQLRQNKAIRRSLPSEASRHLVDAFVVFRLDYCTGLYAKLPRSELKSFSCFLLRSVERHMKRKPMYAHLQRCQEYVRRCAAILVSQCHTAALLILFINL